MKAKSEPMIKVSFYPDEIAVLVKLLGGIRNNKDAEKWKRNFELIYKNREMKIKKKNERRMKTWELLSGLS